MNARTWTATCAAVALGTSVAVFAQNPPSSQSSRSQSSSAKTITVTGCVQRAQPSSTGTTGTRETTPSSTETKFVLTNAAMGSSATAGTPGTPAPSATAIGSEYRLDAEESKLSSHVGHKVELTGTVEQPTGAEQRPAASAANAPTLKVDNVKMVAAKCP